MTKKERPILENLVNSKTTPTEKFQNEVIRPVIKMQHHILIFLFKDYLQNRKIDFSLYSEEKKTLQIKTILQKDTKFKTLILGCIVGSFSIEELGVYAQKTSEYNKRINQIIINRFVDSISEI